MYYTNVICNSNSDRIANTFIFRISVLYVIILPCAVTSALILYILYEYPTAGMRLSKSDDFKRLSRNTSSGVGGDYAIATPGKWISLQQLVHAREKMSRGSGSGGARWEST